MSFFLFIIVLATTLLLFIKTKWFNCFLVLLTYLNHVRWERQYLWILRKAYKNSKVDKWLKYIQTYYYEKIK